MPALFLYFTIFYGLLSGCIIYPPSEFISSGLTIKDIFGRWLGNENEFFVQYHIRRTIITLMVHSLLPLGYLIGLSLFASVDVLALLKYGNPFWIIFAIISLIGPMFTLQKIRSWSMCNWSNHPIINSIMAYSRGSNNVNWQSIVSNINTEYRRVDKVIIDTNSVIRAVATDNWVIKITPYKLYFANQNNAVLIINKTDTHNMSPVTRGEVQYINIKVNSTVPGSEAFDIRLNALDFQDFQNKMSRPIVILQNVVFHKTLLDRFIDTFKDHIMQNLPYETDEDLEQCIGCMQEEANVKLHKQCENGVSVANSCMTCRCRPMWCITCMAKWFASRQDENVPETWLSSKCTCPVCRSTFCILDVSLVKKSIR